MCYSCVKIDTFISITHSSYVYFVFIALLVVPKELNNIFSDFSLITFKFLFCCHRQQNS